MANKSDSAGAKSSEKEVFVCPSVRPPTHKQIKEIANDLGFDLEEESLQTFKKTITEHVDAINAIECLVEPRLPTKYPRLPGYRPEQKDNPLNAWYWRCDIKGADNGKLSGKRVAVKDNVAVAGVPMMNGCHALEGYTPDFDATVVTRVLDAGGTIVGKTVCENLCFSGGSSTAAKGPVKNPHDTGRSTGGSSSGSAVVVSVGEADMAIGGDQGGSVRLPASWTGIVGLKPTYGLVPYTGAMGIEMAVDHLGPMTRTVHDCALFMEVLAGYDNGMDPRQHPHIKVPEYTQELLIGSAQGMKIGILKEGFASPKANPAVDSLVRKSIEALTGMGCIVRDVSIPIHVQSPLIWGATAQGCYENMVRFGGIGMGHIGYYPTSFGIASKKMIASRPNDLSEALKMFSVEGEYLHRYYGNQVYARARNLVFNLRQAYDRALEEVDVLAMPTIPFTASELIHKDDSLSGYFTKCMEMTSNTMAANLTGHPAISVNAGFLDGLPVGLMLVGRHFEETTVLRAAQAVETLREAAIAK
ncbi:amidase-like [Diadema antillarum]|uniref:amidase-like n=1 Tax=Diadema antillarum TaxID=105358 RepID=UPI003A83541E